MNDQFFRASAGAVIVNSSGLVLACRRSDVAGEAWQLPQGGIKACEDPLDAVYREVAEETSIPRAHLELVGTARQWLSYELPEAYRGNKTGRGQTQKWHLFRFTGTADEIEPNPKEFSICQWMSTTELLEKVVEFRRPVYQHVFEQFASSLNL